MHIHICIYKYIHINIKNYIVIIVYNIKKLLNRKNLSLIKIIYIS